MLSTPTVLGLRGEHNYEDAFQQHAKEVILCGGSLMCGGIAVKASVLFIFPKVLLTDL